MQDLNEHGPAPWDERWTNGVRFMPAPRASTIDSWRGVGKQVHEAIAQTSGVPPWLRIVMAGLANARANGHAPFCRGELSEATGIDPRKLTAAIRGARMRGYVEDVSDALCIVVKPWVLSIRPPGDQREPCPEHGSVPVLTPAEDRGVAIEHEPHDVNLATIARVINRAHDDVIETYGEAV